MDNERTVSFSSKKMQNGNECFLEDVVYFGKGKAPVMNALRLVSFTIVQLNLKRRLVSNIVKIENIS